jgi:hypothetical protein
MVSLRLRDLGSIAGPGRSARPPRVALPFAGRRRVSAVAALRHATAVQRTPCQESRLRNARRVHHAATKERWTTHRPQASPGDATANRPPRETKLEHASAGWGRPARRRPRRGIAPWGGAVIHFRSSAVTEVAPGRCAGFELALPQSQPPTADVLLRSSEFGRPRHRHEPL